MELWCPEGYVTFKSVLDTVRIHICEYDTWGIPDSVFDSVDEAAEYLIRSAKIEGNQADEIVCGLRFQFLKGEITRLIASGRLRTAGIDINSGQILVIPVEVWRTNLIKDHQFFRVFFSKFGSSDLFIPSTGQASIACRPLIALRDLAIAFGAESPPHTPPLVPGEWRDDLKPTATTQPHDDTAAKAMLWMRDYVRGENDKGIKPKRNPSLSLCHKTIGCTYRQAEVAWNALPENWKSHSRRAKL